MAAPGNFGVYGFGFSQERGRIERNLLDLITNVDPWDTPWVSQAPKVRAMHVVHEWLRDNACPPRAPLLAPQAPIAVEGDDWAYNTLTTRPNAGDESDDDFPEGHRGV